MRTTSRSIGLLISFVLMSIAPRASAEGNARQWTIDGITRDAIVCTPDKQSDEPAPLIFAFHGHGGRMGQFENVLRLEKFWPEAIVVYPQGVPTPGRILDKEGKLPGWQSAPGDQADRDLKFFDAMLETIKKNHKVDPDRIYITGHSNGATFTYVLWRARGKEIAAFAPIASTLSMLIAKPEAKDYAFPQAVERPILHIAGKKDPLVKFEWQERTIEYLRTFNHCGEGKPWEPAEQCTIYPSKDKAPVIAYIHEDGHAVPKDAPGVIVKFFKEYSLHQK